MTANTSGRDNLPAVDAPVRRAYEQVANQIRDWILSGALKVGERLPPEAALAEKFGTSRSTIREALRTLASESLVQTKSGRGGSSVASPDPEQIVNYLRTAIALLAGTDLVDQTQLLVARRILEVPAAGLAAENRTEADLELLRQYIPTSVGTMTVQQLYRMDRLFHETLLAASGHQILHVMATPLFVVVQTRVRREEAAEDFWPMVVAEHNDILAAVLESDSELAKERMAAHLDSVDKNLHSWSEHE